MEWIKVKDKLPDDGDKVIIYSPCGIETKYFESNIFYDGETCMYCPIGEVKNVTHWMPLPEVPKDEA